MTTMLCVTAVHSIVNFACFVTVTNQLQYLVFVSQNIKVRPETVTK